jgi:hypothetical protein
LANDRQIVKWTGIVDVYILCMGKSALIVSEGRNLKSMEYPQSKSSTCFFVEIRIQLTGQGIFPTTFGSYLDRRWWWDWLFCSHALDFFLVKTFAISMLVVLWEPLQYPFLGSHTMAKNATCWITWVVFDFITFAYMQGSYLSLPLSHSSLVATMCKHHCQLC